MALAARPLEALEVRSLLSQVFTVTNTSDNTSMGSLRWAIGQVNSDGTDTIASPDQIHFNIPTSDPGFGLTTLGVWTIAPATALPIINAPCIIDGYTQPGAAAGTSAGAINATIKVELDGWVGAIPFPNIPYGLSFGGASGNTAGGLTSGVRGLAIHLFDTEVALQGAGTFVQGCFLGTDATGVTTRISQVDDGVDVSGDSNGDVIGGTVPADRNLISGLSTGIVTGIDGDTVNLLVAGNLIGTDLTGTSQNPNVDGISLGAGSGITIGGTTPAARNVLSGNAIAGIVFATTSPTDNVVEGNYIGTDVTGTRGVENYDEGIIFQGGTNNTVGGTSLAAANVISSNGLNVEGPSAGIEFENESETAASDNLIEGNFIGTDATGTQPLGNGGNGIRAEGIGAGNAFLGNVIDFNGAIGIDLVGGTEDSFGVTANSPGGPHGGPNDLQNYPVLTSAVVSAGQTTITGTLNSTPLSLFRVDLYAVPTADPSGHGQALTYLGTTSFETDASGNTTAPFSVTVPRDLTGQQITALATALIPQEMGAPAPGSTSEFSADIPVPTSMAQSADLAAIDPSATPNPVEPGGDITYTVTIINNGPDDAVAVAGTVQVPAHTTFVSLAASDPDVTFQTPPVGGGTGTTITLRAPGALPGQPVTFTLVVQVEPDTPAGTVISNTAVVASLTPDPNTANNTVAASTVVAVPPPPPPVRTPTLTGMSASPNPSTVGQPVTFSALVAPAFPVDGPTGTVTFVVDGTPMATVPLVATANGFAGTAAFATSSLAAGAHTVVAEYGGDASFDPSTSSVVVETVTPPVPPPPVPPPPPPAPAPGVVEVLRYGYHEMPTALAVVFDGPLDPATATDVANYRLVGPGGRAVPVVAAAVLPGDEAVVLQPKGRLNVHWTYTLTVVGTPPAGVTSSAGTYIGFDPVEAITFRNLVGRTKAPVRVPRVRPAAAAVDAVLAAEYRAHLGAIAALGRRR